MNTNETVTLEHQRQRRKRINCIKTAIIFTIIGWIIVSLLAIIILSVQVVHLNHKVDKLNEGMNKVGVQKVSETQKPEKSVAEDHIMNGIDSSDNMAQEGDTHKVYLTFDGSPSKNTGRILDVLDKYGVKATFFVVGDNTDEMKAVYKRIVDEGHTLGMHSYSNKYSEIYASKEAFENDFDKISEYLKNVTGTESSFYRFPGGSGNEASTVDMKEFIRILNQKDVTYFDWNVSAGDASSDYTKEDVIDQVTGGVAQYKTSVVLLHDGEDKSTTVKALAPLIEALQKMDAELLPIDEDTTEIQYIEAGSVD